MKRILLTATVLVFCAVINSVWADHKPGLQQNQQQQTSGQMSSPQSTDDQGFVNHLIGDSALEEKNTGDPNTSLLTSQYANNLPIMNHEKGAQGCYIACYSQVQGVYSVDHYGVHGLIRVSGAYPVTAFSDEMDNRICRPNIDDNAITSESAELKALCNSHFESCQGGCWAGGDTGGFFLRMPNALWH